MNVSNEPIVRVGIIETPCVRYVYKGVEHKAVWSPDFEEIYLPDGPFTLCGVTIGKQFHWEQQEDQTFAGALRIIAMPTEEGGEGHLVAINEVRLEDYLASVISSEMAATNNLELLKAHAIISRSWVMRQTHPQPLPKKEGSGHHHDHDEREHHRHHKDSDHLPLSQGGTEGGADGAVEWIRFWDHDDHTLYDVCADDHCQRYQGTTRQVSPLVAEAIRQTRGMVLTSPELSTAEHLHICDARFYKACGGHTEHFSACWQDRGFHYLEPTPDPYCSPEFIATLPGGMDGVMRQVLNDYDRSTIDYHEWTERYTIDELSALVEKCLHEVFSDAPHLGRITALEPIERGASGRIVRLRIVGTPSLQESHDKLGSEQTPPSVVIGKELLIRKVLSTSHLKSSWFDVEQTADAFILHGHGWGHGAGLCQIGAAAMSLAGFTYDQILAHYYHGAHITWLYQ